MNKPIVIDPKTKTIFQNRPVLLIVLDGWGEGPADDTNAIFLSKTPTVDKLRATMPWTLLKAYGKAVGLPADSDMGGSEVGHFTIGAGRIIEQGPTPIHNAVNDGTFFKSPVLNQLIDNCLQNNVPLHLFGLLSNGNIHSSWEHIEAIVKYADERGVQKVFMHACLDGRDLPPQSAEQFITALDKFWEPINKKPGRFYAFASIEGRDFSMERDPAKFGKLQTGWDAHVLGKAKRYYQSAMEGLMAIRGEDPAIQDQYVPAYVIADADGKPLGAVGDGDSWINFNFRGDRAIPFAQALLQDDFTIINRGRRPERVLVAGMKVYDEDTNFPPLQIMGPVTIHDAFPTLITEAGLKQFRAAETTKYAHATFFLNGGRKEPLNHQLENYVLVPSQNVAKFSQAPEMSALGIADEVVKLIKSGEYRFGFVNFANPDMVAHDGSIEATVRGVETTDTQLGRVIEAARAYNTIVCVTADHGNADEAFIRNKKTGAKEPSTKHSLNPVQFIIYDPKCNGIYKLKQDKDLGLSNIAGTVLQLMGYGVPEGLRGSMLEMEE